MRSNLTDAERKLWSHLRYKQLNCLRFRRQHPIGPYVVDFVCLEVRLIIEVDGGQHGSPHAERDQWLQSQGYQILRFWNNDVLTNIAGVLTTIETMLGN